ncbi:hypothetical protein [Xanthobacter sediminis]
MGMDIRRQAGLGGATRRAREKNRATASGIELCGAAKGVPDHREHLPAPDPQKFLLRDPGSMPIFEATVVNAHYSLVLMIFL